MSKRSDRVVTIVNLTDCEHSKLLEIGEDFDNEGRLVRLLRCQECGLLMRKHLLTI